MKKRIKILLVCTLLVIYTMPVLGITNETNYTAITNLEPNQNYRLKVKHLDDDRLPPDPGELVPGFVFETHEKIQISTNPPSKSLTSNEETIIDILQNLDEDLILGYLEDIVAFGPRVTGSSACQAAGDYIYNEFVSYGLEAKYDDWSYYGYLGNNIEGTLYGVNESSDEIYIICAHYDSVSGSPGADDDGSGTAAVLAAAYLMSQYEFNHTIRFVTFDGEEQGLLGSHEYAEEAYGNGDNIVGALNGDMIGYAENPSQASMVKIYENSASQWITDFTEDVNQNYDEYFELTIVPSGSSSGSDHASFWAFGYHAIFYHEYKFNSYYHSSGDTIEHMDLDYCTRVSRLIIATLGELSEAQIMSEPPETPIKPNGPEEWPIDIEVIFSTSTIDPEGDSIYYLFNWGDGTDSGWIGPYPSGQTIEASHIWTELGDYEVKVMAQDIYNSKSDWSEPAIISIVENQPPEKPTITGPNTGKVGIPLEFTFVSMDPEGHDVYYMVIWGDGHIEDYVGPYASGEEATFSHTYSSAGDFNIIAKAQDQYGAKGQQNNFQLTITKNKAVTNPVLLRLLEKIMDQLPILRYLVNI